MDPAKKIIAKELSKESAKIMAKVVGKRVAEIMLVPVFDVFGFGSSSNAVDLKPVLDKLNLVLEGENKILNKIDNLAESVKQVHHKTIIATAELEIQHYIKTMRFICKIQNKEERDILVKHLSSAPYGGMKLFENIMNITSALSGTIISGEKKGFLSAIIEYKFGEYFKNASDPNNNLGLFVLDIQIYFSNLLMLLAKGMQCLTAIRFSEDLDETIAFEQEIFRDSISGLMTIFNESVPGNLRQIIYRMNEQNIEPKGVNPEYQGKSLILDFPMGDKPLSRLEVWRNKDVNDKDFIVHLASDQLLIDVFNRFESSDKWLIEPLFNNDDKFYIKLNNIDNKPPANKNFYLSLLEDGIIGVSQKSEASEFRIVVGRDDRLGLAIIGDENAGFNYVCRDESKLYSREYTGTDSNIPSPFAVSEYVPKAFLTGGLADNISSNGSLTDIGNPLDKSNIGSLGDEPLLGNTPIFDNRSDDNIKPPTIGPLGPSLGNLFKFNFKLFK